MKLFKDYQTFKMKIEKLSVKYYIVFKKCLGNND